MTTINTEETQPDSKQPSRRPVGLAEGELVVPDDFDDPLPDEIQQLFEGSWEPCVETHG